MEKKKTRLSNFELMRIISMFFIVLWHIFTHGKVHENASGTLLFIIDILMTIIIVHCNSLVFITGYFSCNNKKSNTKKSLKLIGTTWFYKVLFLIIFIFVFNYKLSEITIFEELLPLDYGNYWFINCYLVIYILSPYLNRIIEKMKEEDFHKFIITIMLLLSVIPAVTNCRVIDNNGYNLINFVILYFLGAFFRKYPLKENYHFKYFSNKKLKITLFICLIFLCVIRLSFYYLGINMCNMNNKLLSYFGKIITNDMFRYSSPLIIIETCIYCLLFETINIKSKIVNFCAKSTLGIYLIHDNGLVKSKLYEYTTINMNNSTIIILLNILKYAVIIFIVSFIIETMRRIIIDIIRKIRNNLKINLNKT